MTEPMHGHNVGRQIPNELHPHDERVIAVFPIYNSTPELTPDKYTEAIVITVDTGKPARYWVGRFIAGRHVEGSSYPETTVRKAIKRALAMGGWG